MKVGMVVHLETAKAGQLEKSSAGHLMEHSVTTWFLQACAVTE